MPLIYSFGDCELDEGAFELRRAGRRVEMQPKTLELLLLLVRQRDRVVPKDEIMQTLWSDAIVGDSSLTRCMSLLRRAIGDAGRDGAIRTVSRHGYRFCAPTSERALARPPAEPPRAALELPPAVRPSELPFVGREGALATLVRAESDAREGRARVVALVGPAGIGKTRLLDAFLARCGAAGCAVASGRCPEGAPQATFWPWGQILRGLRDALDPPHAERRALEPLVAALARDPGPLLEGRHAQDRFRVFDEIAQLLGRLGSQGPGALVLAIDDLHRADAASLMLLRYLAHELGASRVLLLVALRKAGEVGDSALEEALGDLQRVDRFECEQLHPFGSEEIAALVRERLGGEGSSALVHALTERTEGNPFFVREALRWLERERARTGGALPQEIDVPGARGMFEPRFRALSGETRGLLELASVAGREMPWSLLADASPLVREALLAALGEAERADLLLPLPGGLRYRFSHALVREVLYAGLTSVRRAELHRAVGEALEKHRELTPEAVLPELAHHFFHASLVVDPERAVHYAVTHARSARGRLAPEDAAEHYARALQLLELCDPPDPQRRLDLLLELGRAHAESGDARRRRESFRAAADLARPLGRSDALAQAALGYSGSGEWRAPDRAAGLLLQEALDAAQDPGDRLRARLLARLAHTPLAGDKAAELALRALDFARRSADPEALCEAQHALHFVLEGPDGWAQRASVSEEIVHSGTRAGRADLVLEIRLERLADRLRVGDRAGADAELAEAARVAADSHDPWFRWLEKVSEVGIALLRGELAQIERALSTAFALGQRVQAPWALPIALVQTFAWRRQAGPLEALAPLVRTASAPSDWSSSLVGVAPAIVCLELGDTSGACEAFEVIASQGFTRIARDRDWLATLTELAAVCAFVGDRERGEALESLLAPYAGQEALIPYVVYHAGPVDRALGLLAVLRGDLARAADRFEAALGSTARLGARPWQARVQVALGALLLAHGGTERSTARALVQAAEQTASALGTQASLAAERRLIERTLERGKR